MATGILFTLTALFVSGVTYQIDTFIKNNKK